MMARSSCARASETCTSRSSSRIRRSVIAASMCDYLQREFSVDAPNQKWAGDITYIRTDEGWLYLAVLLDLFSRRIVGWAVSEYIDEQLVPTALTMALTQRQPGDGLLVHTDRGVQY